MPMTVTSAPRYFIAFLLLLFIAPLALSAESADSIYFNGKIYTVSTSQPWAEALAVRNGRIASVGSDDEVLALAGADTVLHDLDGAMLLPGVTDAHVHALQGALKNIYQCNFPFSATPDEVASTLKACVEQRPDATWIRGGQWDSGFFDRFDLASPKALLDAVSGDKAVYLSDDSGHNAWLNSKALEEMGISSNTPDPEDGTIVRLAGSKEPNGVLLEGPAQAAQLKLPEWTDQELLAAASESVRLANLYGITAMKLAIAPESSMRAYQVLDSQSRLTAHVAMSMETPYGSRKTPLDYAAYDQLRDEYASPHVDPRYIKIFMDGVPTSSRTAAMLHPYTPDKEGHSAVSGELHIAPELLEQDLVELDRRGYTVKIHTAGDRSVRVALDAIAAARRENGDSGLRHELAHAGYIDGKDLPRFAAVNAVADLSPYLWHPSPIMDSVMGAVGPQGDHYFPIKALLEADAPVLAGSDWPSAVETMDPWLGLEAMVTRSDPQGRFEGTLWPEQAISLEQAIAIFTIKGAEALRLADQTGSIEVGKSADFVVLSDNLFDIEPENISEVKVLRTVFEGETVYATEKHSN